MQELISTLCILTWHQKLQLSWVGSDAVGSKTSLWRIWHPDSQRHFSCHVDCANGRKSGVAWEMTISAMLPRSQPSPIAINMSAACTITACIAYGWSRGIRIFILIWGTGPVLHRVCLSLLSGVSERKTVKWGRQSPCTLLWVNIPLKSKWLFLPLDQNVFLMCELKGAHWAFVCLLLISRCWFFSLLKRWLLFYNPCISAHYLHDPSLCGCTWFLPVLEVGFVFFLRLLQQSTGSAFSAWSPVTKLNAIF